MLKMNLNIERRMRYYVQIGDGIRSFCLSRGVGDEEERQVNGELMESEWRVDE